MMEVGSRAGYYTSKSPKMILHEWCNRANRPKPRYKAIATEDGRFRCKVAAHCSSWLLAGCCMLKSLAGQTGSTSASACSGAGTPRMELAKDEQDQASACWRRLMALPCSWPGVRTLTLISQVVLPDLHRADMDTVILLPSDHAADDADTAEQRGAVAALQQARCSIEMPRSAAVPRRSLQNCVDHGQVLHPCEQE